MAVVAKGLRETIRSFNKLERSVSRNLTAGLKKVAEPVRDASRAKISRYPGAKTGSIGLRASVGSVFVTQRAPKVTGLRGDFGALQMRRMTEALSENQDEVEQGLERELDRWTSAAGL